jgi:hypothetical protein
MKWVVALAALSVGCDGGLCDPDAVQRALEAAVPGDEVALGACTIEGSFDVPIGVTLSGQDGTTIAGSVSLDNDATLADLTVRAGVGTAVTAENVAQVTLERVVLVGPVTAESDVPIDPSADEWATHGIVATGVREVNLDDVTVRGFARFGALFVATNVTWTGGVIEGNHGTGMMAASGIISITDLRIAGTLATSGIVPSYAAVFRSGARVHTEDLVVEDNEGYGILHDAADGGHVSLRAERNAEPAVWVQSTDDFALAGEGTLLADNGLAGLVATDVTSLYVADVTVRGTLLRTRIVGTGDIEVGDGMHIVVASTADVRLERLALEDNARAGLLLESADGMISEDAIGPITVSAGGDANGAVAQSTTAIIPIGEWGASIERSGAASANDASLIDRLSIVGAVAPMFLPGD